MPYGARLPRGRRGRLCRQCGGGRQRHEPDAMLVDVRLGDGDGFAVCDAVTRVRPHLAVLLTSTENCEHLIESCGARGFILKHHLADVDFGRFWQSA